MTAAVDAPTSPGAARRMLAAAVLASFVSFLDGSITTVALPAIARELHGGVATQQWVVDGYLLTLSALILLSGAVSDAVGRVRVLRIALVAFALTSLLCAVAPTAGVLVAARVLQGAAGALLVPGSLSLVIATFAGAAQARAIGSWTAWTSVSSLLGPVLGGVLVDSLGWRSVFVVGLAPAAAAMALLGRTRDAARTGPVRHIDAASSVLAASGLAGLTAGLIELGAGRDATLPPSASATLLGAGILLLAALLVRNGRIPHPLVPPGLFAARNFAAGNASTLFVYAALGLASLVPALFLQEVVGLRPTVAALLGLPATVLLVALSGRFGALAGRFGPRAFMSTGPLVAAVGAVVTTFVRAPEGAVPLILAGTVLTGLGLSITVAPLTAAVLGAVPPQESGIGSAVNNAVARVAGLVSTASAGWILGGAISVPGLVRSAAVTAVLLALGALAAFVGVRGGPTLR